VKLVDFGVAKASSAATGPKGKVQGKFSYMAPEKLKGAAGDRRSDIFSLGCVMWEALTLKRLFRGANDADTMKQVLDLNVQLPSKVNSDVTAGFDPIVMRCLDRDPNKRYPTAKELANDLEHLLHTAGYAAKNDRIAKYMQETFKDHIEARKKLVQEVVSKGSASAETVDAAFNSAAQLAHGSPRTPTMGDFSIVRPLPVRPSPPVIVPPVIRSVIPSILPSSVVPDAFSDQNKPTEISASPFETQTNGGNTSTANDSGATEIGVPPVIIDDREFFDAEPIEAPKSERPPSGPPAPSRLVTVMDWFEDIANDKRKRTIAAVVASGILLLIVILMIAKCGGGEAKPVADKQILVELPDAPHVAIAVDAAVVVEAPPVDAAPPPPPDAAVAVVQHHPIEHHVVTPPPNVDATFGKALQAYVKGDLKTALALLKTAKVQNPQHAATWRLLGQVYKKLGDHAQAKAAFTRYVQLAPNAPDIPTIKKELE
jgi:hypothetical protein